MGLLFLFAGINNTHLGGISTEARAATWGRMILGISELLEKQKCFLFFSLFIFCP